MKDARFIIRIVTVLAFIATVAEYFLLHPHVQPLEAIVAVCCIVLVFILAHLFILLIVHNIIEC